jgi:hypothetical protein
MNPDELLTKWADFLTHVPKDKHLLIARMLQNQEDWLKSPNRKPEDFNDPFAGDPLPFTRTLPYPEPK